MGKKPLRFLLCVSGGVLVFAVVMLLVAVEHVVPTKPERPYLLPAVYGVTDLGWDFGRIQPVYLWNYEKNGAAFLMTAFRDNKGLIRFLRVLVGGQYDGKDLPLATYVRTEDDVIRNKRVGEFSYPLEFGQQLMVEYMEASYFPSNRNSMEVCQVSQRVCDLAEIVVDKRIKDPTSDDVLKTYVLSQEVAAIGIYPDTEVE